MKADERTDAHSDDPSRLFIAGLVALTFVMNAIGRGVSECFAVFLLPVEKALGVDRAAIAATYSVYMIAYGVAAPLAGQLIDRIGVRACYTLGLVSLGVGNLVAASAETIWIYYLGVGVFGGIGTAALGMVAASSLLSRWFQNKLSTAASVPYAAVGGGMLIFPPLAQILSDGYGWRFAHQTLGWMVLAALVVLVLVPIRRYSEGSSAWQELRARASVAGESPWPVSRALQTSAFWMLFLAYFATAVAAYAVLPHSVAYLVEQGFSPIFAASAFGLTGVLSFIGIMVVGWASDRFGRVGAALWSYIVTTIGIVALIFAGPTGSVLLVYLFVLGFGLMQGARGPILVGLVAQIYKGGSVGAIFGTLSLALGTGAAAGSWASGALHEWTGGYRWSFVMAIAAVGVGMVAFGFSRSLREGRVIGPA